MDFDPNNVTEGPFDLVLACKKSGFCTLFFGWKTPYIIFLIMGVSAGLMGYKKKSDWVINYWSTA